MAEITNERLLKEIQGTNARLGDLMRRIQKLENDIRTSGSGNRQPQHNNTSMGSVVMKKSKG